MCDWGCESARICDRHRHFFHRFGQYESFRTGPGSLVILLLLLVLVLVLILSLVERDAETRDEAEVDPRRHRDIVLLSASYSSHVTHRLLVANGLVHVHHIAVDMGESGTLVVFDVRTAAPEVARERDLALLAILVEVGHEFGADWCQLCRWERGSGKQTVWVGRGWVRRVDEDRLSETTHGSTTS